MAGAFSASSSRGERVTEHQGLAQGAEEPGNRLREGGREGGGAPLCQIQTASGACLAQTPSIPPPEALLGRALQKKEDLLGKAHCLVAPCGNMAALGRDIAIQVRALGLVLHRGGKGWQTAPGTQLG